MSYISKMSIKLAADAAGLVSGLGKAGAAVQSFASKSAATLGTLAKTAGVGGLLSGATVAGVYAAFRAGLSDLEATDRQAAKLGLTVGELRGAMLWAGDGAGSMAGVVESLQGRLADLRAGSVLAKEDFAGLAKLSGQGMSGLASGGFMDSLEQVAEALAKIPDRAVRAAQAFRLLGPGAADVLARIEQGGAGVRGAAGMAKGFGLGVGREDMQNVRAAADAMRQLEALGKGVFNMAMVAAAPIIRALSEGSGLAKANIEWMRPAMLEIARAAGMFGAFFIEAFKDASLWKDGLAVLWEAVEGVGERLKAALLSAIYEAGKALQRLLPTVSQAVEDTMDDLVKKVRTMPGMPGAMGPHLPEGFQPETALERVMRRLGETKTGKAVNDLVNRAKEFREEMEKALMPPANVVAGMQQRFDALRQAAMGPGETFRAAMQDIGRMGAAGLLAGNDAGPLGAFRAFDALRGSAGQYQPTGAALAGSREAYSALAQNEAMQRRGDVQQQIKQLLENAQRQRDEQIRIGKDLLREFGNREEMAVLEE